MSGREERKRKHQLLLFRDIGMSRMCVSECVCGVHTSSYIVIYSNIICRLILITHMTERHVFG